MQDSFVIRKATPADAAAIAKLHVKTFRETHGIFSSPALSTRQWQWDNIFQHEDETWFCFVIEKDEKELIGFSKGQLYSHPDQPRFSGELNKIYLLKKYQKLDLGRQMICKVATEFINRGVNSMLLFGDARNSSNGFYERMGAKKIYAANGEFHGGYGWENLQVLTLNCSNI